MKTNNTNPTTTGAPAATEHAMRWVLVILGVPAVLAVTYFASSAYLDININTRSLALHLLLIFCLSYLSVTICTVLAALARYSAGKKTVSVLITGFMFIETTLLIIFYGLNLLSNLLWGENITAELFYEYIANGNFLISALPLSKAQLTLFFLLVALLLTAILLSITYVVKTSKTIKTAGTSGLSIPLRQSAYLALSTATIFVFLCYLLDKNNIAYLIRLTCVIATILILAFTGYRFFKKEHRNRISAIFITTLTACLACAITLQQFNHASRVTLTKEPFWSFFTNAESIGASLRPHRINIAQLDKLARENYHHTALQKPNVIVITMDALRPDHTSLYGYERNTTPYLNSLKSSGKLQTIELAVSSCASSYCGILSLLSSKPSRDITAGNFKINELLKDQGYRINFVLSGTHKNYYKLGKAYGTDIDYYYEGGLQGHELNNDSAVIAGLSKIPDYANDPNFFYLHFMSTHLAGIKQKNFQKFQPATIGFTKNSRANNPIAIVNRYDNSIQQGDSYIQTAMEILQSKGYLQNSIVIITSDHGESLGRQYPIGHGWNVSQELIRIPLAIMNSLHRPLNRDYAAQIDIAPTIADYLGLPKPTVWAGESLFNSVTPRFTYHETAKTGKAKSIIRWDENTVLKYTHIKGSDSRETLFDLLQDPDEAINILSSTDPKLLKEFRMSYRNHWRTN